MSTNSESELNKNQISLCRLLSINQKRELAAEKFEVHNYVYRNICHSEMMMSDFKGGDGYGIFSGSRNYDDVYVSFNKLNERQIALLNKWGVNIMNNPSQEL